MEIITRSLYQCGICGTEYREERAALRCETRGIEPSLPVGTFVELSLCSGPWRLPAYYGEVREILPRCANERHEAIARVACGNYGEQTYDINSARPACRVCLQSYATIEEAQRCEAHARPQPKFQMGDAVCLAARNDDQEPNRTVHRVAAILWFSAPELNRLGFGRSSFAPHGPVYHLPDTFIRTLWAEDELVAAP